ncbi:MAG: hypothetical protein R2739_06760 [Chitinophagales bacterium]|nr:hypothetical protein [Bacteroidota bacterium]
MRRYMFLLLTIFGLTMFSYAQDTLVQKLPNQLMAISFKQSFQQATTIDSLKMKIPKYKQGIICDFEDKLNRKKIPLDFSLGKNQY